MIRQALLAGVLALAPATLHAQAESAEPVQSAPPLSLAASAPPACPAPAASVAAVKPASVLIMPTDYLAGEVSGDGKMLISEEVTARIDHELAAALTAQLEAADVRARVRGETDYVSADERARVDDHDALHYVVAHDMQLHWAAGEDYRLPSKHGCMDWSIGPGLAQFGQRLGVTHMLFVFGRDFYASSERQALQVFGALGCLFGTCIVARGSYHDHYASLVEIATGQIVWFRQLDVAQVDVRHPGIAAPLADALIGAPAAPVAPPTTKAQPR